MANDQAAWQPVLHGQDALAAWNAASAIAADVAETEPQSATINGSAGHALLYAYLFRVSRDSRYAERAIHCHAAAVEAAAMTRMGPSLFGGVAGIAWMDEHVRRVLADADGAGPVDHVCTLLRSLVGGSVAYGYDLMSGWVGWGVYAVERAPSSSLARECLSAIVDRLFETAEARDGGMTWYTPSHHWSAETRHMLPRGMYVLGMAHGVAGVVAMLSYALRSGLNGERTGRLLDGAVQWILAQRRRAGGQLGLPPWVTAGGSPLEARCTWCYGDLGVACALAMAADVTGNSDWEEAAIAIALRSVALSPADAGIPDAGLCHGAAGVAQMYLRLLWLTGNQAFADAARAWVRQIIAMRRADTGTRAGYLSLHVRRANGEESRHWRRDASVMTGSAGTALVLLAAASHVSPDWDRLLLLS